MFIQTNTNSNIKFAKNVHNAQVRILHFKGMKLNEKSLNFSLLQFKFEVH